MIIDKEQLVTLLKEKTGLEREKVEDHLLELGKRIQQAAEENKTFEIEGFGKFRMEEDNLHFEPSEVLETEINNKYAGMKPIELIGAFKEPEGDDVPAIDENVEGIEDKTWAFDKKAKEESKETPEPIADTLSDEEASEAKEAAEKLISASEEKQESDISEKESDRVLEEMVSSMEEPNEPEMPVDKKQSEPEGGHSEEEENQSERENDKVGMLLIAAVLVIAIGLTGWMAYDTGLIGSSNDTENYSQAGPTVAQQAGQPQIANEQDGSPQNSEADISSEPEQEMSVGTQDPPPEEEIEEAGYGLKGEVNENISSSYTIVVHSLRKLDEAEERKNNLQTAGYRALISKANVQGTTYFRVGLGQFETVEDAQQAISDIPESFQKNQGHFIKRIQ